MVEQNNCLLALTSCFFFFDGITAFTFPCFHNDCNKNFLWFQSVN